MIEENVFEEREVRMKRLIQQYLNLEWMSNQVSDVANQETEVKEIPFDLDKMREVSPELAEQCLNNPLTMIPWIQEEFMEYVKRLKEGGSVRQEDDSLENFHLKFEGNFGKNTITPRGLRSHSVNKLVKVKGIVVSVSNVKPRLIRSVHYCEADNTDMVKEYHDTYQIVQDSETIFQNNVIPTKKNEKDVLTMEWGLCEYKDIQRIQMQEMPENVPPGMLSRSIEIVLSNHLVDSIKPGDRVEVVGVLKTRAVGKSFAVGVFRSFLLATGVYHLKSVLGLNLSYKDADNAKKLALKENLYEILSRSIAPGIEGHDYVKQGVLTLLVGGLEKKLDNGTKIRGDINVLLIGDPSTAKSQFLRKVLHFAPLAFNTTGRGSSGVGLTASVGVDKDSGDRQLEAGAMVLADKGVLCIDEFDKMDVIDRVAMHEVMEQQTVTISKAGIHVSLNARCSVLAAANPIYGEYLINRPPNYNIGMPDSLLSRFDLIFLVLDMKNPDMDRKIAKKVTANHAYKGEDGQEKNLYSKVNDMSGIIEQDIYNTNVKQTSEMYQKFYRNGFSDTAEEKNYYLSQDFLKKYIGLAKSKKPQLTEAARNYISDIWTELRSIDDDLTTEMKTRRIMQCTVRSIESMIRIATSFAKLRLSDKIEIKDCGRALELFMYCFYQIKIRSNEIPDEFVEFVDKIRVTIPNFQIDIVKKRKGNRNNKIEEEKNEDEPKLTSKSSKRGTKTERNTRDKATPKVASKSKKMISAENKQKFYVKFIEFINLKLKEIYKKGSDDNSINFNELFTLIKESGDPTFAEITSTQIFKRHLKKLENDNKLILDSEEGKIYMIV
jgi:DNA replication licensing factor MCM3